MVVARSARITGLTARFFVGWKAEAKFNPSLTIFASSLAEWQAGKTPATMDGGRSNDLIITFTERSRHSRVRTRISGPDGSVRVTHLPVDS